MTFNRLPNSFSLRLSAHKALKSVLGGLSWNSTSLKTVKCICGCVLSRAKIILVWLRSWPPRRRGLNPLPRPLNWVLISPQVIRIIWTTSRLESAIIYRYTQIIPLGHENCSLLTSDGGGCCSHSCCSCLRRSNILKRWCNEAMYINGVCPTMSCTKRDETETRERKRISSSCWLFPYLSPLDSGHMVHSHKPDRNHIAQQQFDCSSHTPGLPFPVSVLIAFYVREFIHARMSMHKSFSGKFNWTWRGEGNFVCATFYRHQKAGKRVDKRKSLWCFC